MTFNKNVRVTHSQISIKLTDLEFNCFENTYNFNRLHFPTVIDKGVIKSKKRQKHLYNKFPTITVNAQIINDVIKSITLEKNELLKDDCYLVIEVDFFNNPFQNLIGSGQQVIIF